MSAVRICSSRAAISFAVSAARERDPASLRRRIGSSAESMSPTSRSAAARKPRRRFWTTGPSSPPMRRSRLWTTRLPPTTRRRPLWIPKLRQKPLRHDRDRLRLSRRQHHRRAHRGRHARVVPRHARHGGELVLLGLPAPGRGRPPRKASSSNQPRGTCSGSAAAVFAPQHPHVSVCT